VAREAVALAFDRVDEVRVAELAQAIVQDRRARVSAGLAERPESRSRRPELPDDAERPPPPEQIEERHDGAAGTRAADGTARFRRIGHGKLALLFL